MIGGRNPKATHPVWPLRKDLPQWRLAEGRRERTLLRLPLALLSHISSPHLAVAAAE